MPSEDRLRSRSCHASLSLPLIPHPLREKSLDFPRLRKVDCRRTRVTQAAHEAFLKRLPGWIEMMREVEEKLARQQERLNEWHQALQGGS
jgi:hypothetical protein